MFKRGENASGGGGQVRVGSSTWNTSSFTYIDVPSTPTYIIWFYKHSTAGIGIYEYDTSSGDMNGSFSRSDISMRGSADLSSALDLSVSGKVGFKNVGNASITTFYYDIYC